MTQTGGRLAWGERSVRWAGVRSEIVDIHGGMRVHVLRADPDAAAPPDAPTNFLIHPMGTGAWSWLDVIGPLSAHGAVIAPDLPGSGRSRPRRRDDARASASARHLGELAATLGINRLVVHGHSMGGLVAVLFADLAPERVDRLVLVDPTLPGIPDTAFESLVWRTVGRLALAAVQPFARVVVPVALRYKAATPEQMARSLARIGTDASRVSPELLVLAAEEVARFRVPWRAEAAISAITSAFALMTLEQRTAARAIDRIAAPTLLLWGEHDRVITRPLIDQISGRRPDWDLHTFKSVGHMPPWEVPQAYVDSVGAWLGGATRK